MVSASRVLTIRGVLDGSLSDSCKSRVLERLGVSPDELSWLTCPASVSPGVDTWDADVASVLSSAQISPQVGSQPAGGFQVSRGGRSVRIKVSGGGRVGGGVRQAITGFSGRSRNGLLHLVNSFDRRVLEPSWFRFVTLTYPEAYPGVRSAKRDLDTLLKRFFREFGPRGLLWKLEPQRRGAPHFHLLVLMGRVEDLPGETEWWANAWADVVGSEDPNHRRWHLGQLGAGNVPCVALPREWNGVLSYVGKYLGKTFEGCSTDLPVGWDRPGRFWGVRHRALLPVDVERVDLEERHRGVLTDLRRGVVRYLNHQPSGWVFFTCRLTGQRQKMRRAAAVSLAKSITGDIVEIRKRWRWSRGGVSAFLPSDQFDRLLAWACEKNGLRVEDLHSPGVESLSPI